MCASHPCRNFEIHVDEFQQLGLLRGAPDMLVASGFVSTTPNLCLPVTKVVLAWLPVMPVATHSLWVNCSSISCLLKQNYKLGMAWHPYIDKSDACLSNIGCKQVCITTTMYPMLQPIKTLPSFFWCQCCTHFCILSKLFENVSLKSIHLILPFFILHITFYKITKTLINSLAEFT